MVAHQVHTLKARFESSDRNQGGDLIRKHRVGGASKTYSLRQPRVIEVGYRTEKPYP